MTTFASMITDEAAMIRAADETCCGYFMIAIPQYDVFQGFFIDRVYVKNATGLIEMYRHDTEEGEVPDVLLDMIIRFFLGSGTEGGLNSNRVIRRNADAIGLFGAAIGRLVAADYFWIEAKIDVAANKVTGVVHKLEFNREPNASLRVGRDALMNVPQIADIRRKLAAQTS